jgi:hypothetical protein
MGIAMPQLANDILDDNIGSPAILYVALGRKGDSSKAKSQGDGGLGKTFNTDLSKAAFNINSKLKTVAKKALNIAKLWELCLAYKDGAEAKGISSANANKHIICLAFLIKQETTDLGIAAYQEQAYADILYYYRNKTGYQGQMLQPKSESAETVEDKINKLKKEFLRTKARLETERRAEIEREEHDARSLSSGHTPYGHEGHSTQMKASTSDPILSQSRAGSTSYISQRFMYDNSGSSEEEKPESIPEAIQYISIFLKKMEANTTTPDGTQFSIRDIKTAHRMFFLVRVPKLTLVQLRVLSYLLSQVVKQPATKPEEKIFNTARYETSWWRRFFQGTYGNTRTFEIMASKVQTILLHKLTQQEFPNKYPEDKLDEFDLNRIVEPVERIPLEQKEFQTYQTLFTPSYNRWPNRPPAVLEQFNNRFVAGSPRHSRGG